MTDYQNEIFKDISAGFKLIKVAVGKEKETALRKVKEDHHEAWRALWWLLNPLTAFGVGDKSLDKQINKPVTEDYDNIFTLLAELNASSGVDDQKIRNIQFYLDGLIGEYAEIARGLITKSIRLGVTANTVNKIHPGYIPQFSCMLANKFFEHPNEVNNKSFTLTEKLDGCRCILLMNINSGKVELWSRQGQRIAGLVDIETSAYSMWDKCKNAYALDGELIVADRDNIASKDQYKQTMKIVRSDGVKHGITYNVFDIMPVREFNEQDCTLLYSERRELLETLMAIDNDGDKIDKYPFLHVVPALYSGTDTKEIQKHLDEQRSRNHGGIMINMNDALYEFKRTNVLLKVKVMQDCDLRIIDIEEGTGKFSGTLGSIIVDYKGNRLGVGSGISNDIRKQIWAKPDDYIGRVATIQYFEETQSADGTLSLRFPVFKELREEGKEVSYS